MASIELLEKCGFDEKGETAKQPCYVEQDRRSESLDKTAKPKEQKFGNLNVLFACVSIGCFYFDIVTDVLLAKDYYNQENMFAFGLTTAFIIVPSLVICFLNVRWYFTNYHVKRKKYSGQTGKYYVESRALWFVRFAMTISMMSPVIRQIEYMYNGIKSNQGLSEQEKKRHFGEMKIENVDACSLRMFECFLEAAPQLVLQIYMVLEHRQDESWLTATLRSAAILTSWLSLSWSMLAFHKSLRYFGASRLHMKVPGMILYFLWRACEIGPRVIALGLFWSQFNYLIFIVVGVHWVLMIYWSFCGKRFIYANNACEVMFVNAICGYVLVFSFLNVHGGHTRYRMMLFYMVMYLENWSMMGFWFYFTPDKNEWFYLPAFFIVSLSIFVHIFFQVTYYACFHPGEAGEIPCCLPFHKDYLCNSGAVGIRDDLLYRDSKRIVI